MPKKDRSKSFPSKGRIRAARVSDYFEISSMAGEIFAPYGDYTQVLPGYLLVPSVRTFVYEIRNDLVGFIQVHVDQQQLQDDHVLSADILSAAVSPRHQGKGLGTALFQHVFQWLRPLSSSVDFARVLLTVAHTNHRAMRFFRRMGFSLDGEELGTYSGGQRALRMSRRLSMAGSDGPQNPDNQDP